MTKSRAIFDLLRDAQLDRYSVASYKRTLAACKTLGLNDEDTPCVLRYIDYVQPGGALQNWLQSKLDARKK